MIYYKGKVNKFVYIFELFCIFDKLFVFCLVLVNRSIIFWLKFCVDFIYIFICIKVVFYVGFFDVGIVVEYNVEIRLGFFFDVFVYLDFFIIKVICGE